MSIDLDWETLTGGPDGEALAVQIRDFIHTKFQAVQLPRFIKSVTVHEFQFGSIPPRVTLKDICDPLPDFYEEMPEADEMDDEDDDDGGGQGDSNEGADEGVPDAIKAAERRRRDELRKRLGVDGSSRSSSPRPGSSASEQHGYPPHIHTAGLRSAPGTPDLTSPFLGLGVSKPGIPGGTANMHYFPSHIATGWSGTQTPLAAMAGAQHLHGWLESDSGSSYPRSPSSSQGGRARIGGHHRNPSQGSISNQDFATISGSNSLAPGQALREKHSVSTLAPTSAGTSRPPTRDTTLVGSAIGEEYLDGSSSSRRHGQVRGGSEDEDEDEAQQDDKSREPRVEDLQAVFRIRYAGDVKLMLTAEILLDYPMPSFVGIPVKLNITGLSFDGVGVVANIRKRVHFCFLSPDDALAAVGEDGDSEDEDGGQSSPKRRGARMGGLLQEIKVESEIGQREGSKQSLKNVGKVERFVLEQVRRIFEEEFVYPSFWTFLV